MYRVLICALIGFFIYSALQLVSIRYQQRLIFNQMEKAEQVEKELQNTWRTLELERATLTTSASIGNIVNSKLGLEPANLKNIIYLKQSELTPLPQQTEKSNQGVQNEHEKNN